MRLRRLDLLRYGHLADTALDFPSNAGLCVIEGANEAGKSTALAAIGDALFGFADERRKDRWRPDTLYPAARLRIGVSLLAGDGSEASFVRRKGRGDTLSDPTGETVPEAAMRRFLGGAGRDLFEHGFGLNGERLRAGADALLAGGGGIGESLAAAGTGLFGLRAAAAALDDEAARLVGHRRGRQRFWLAMDQWREADRRAQQLAVRPKAWQETESAHAAAAAALAEMQEQASALAAEANRLQRARRVAPILAALDQARAGFAAVSDAPAVPAGAEAERQRAVQARDEAARLAARAGAEAARLMAVADALPRDPAVLAVAEEIDRIAGLLPVARQAEADLPAVREELVDLLEAAARAAAELGFGTAVDEALAGIPASALREAVQALLDRQAALETARDTAARERREAIGRRDAAAAALAVCVAPPDPALLRATVDRVRGEGRLDADLAKADLAFATATARVGTALAALPLWQRSVEALAAAPVPLPTEIEAAASRHAEADRDVSSAAEALAAIEAECAGQEDALARLAAGDAVPTPALIAARREARDRAWRGLRRQLEGDAAVAADPAAFESLLAEADRLADRRADEAQRVHAYLAAEARRDLLRARLPAAVAGRDAALAARAALESAWVGRWAASGIEPSPPAAMAEWLRRRSELLALAAGAETAGTECRELAARRDAARDALCRLLPGASGAEPLASLLTRAEVACAAAEAAVREWRERDAALAHAAEALPRREREAHAAEAAIDAWREDWATGVALIGLRPDTDLAAARARLAAWARLDAVAPKFRSDTTRVRRMETTVASLRAEVRAVLEALGSADEPAVPTTAGLVARLAAARQTEQDVVRLTAEIARHRRQQQAATREAAAADAVLAALRATTGTADDEALRLAIVRAAEREARRGEIASRAAALAEQGDGRDETALRAEAGDVDPDHAVARLAEIEAVQAALGARREAASAERARLAAMLDAMRQGQEAAAAAQEARHALADAKDAVERYARVHIARELLRGGIERFRRSQQAPLLAAAGRHFAALTAGRYVRLDVDEAAGGRRTLAAVRADESACPVEALSEGTRDQLYLALRVASVEAYAADAEPLPFIADDLLVHFDDARAAAAIALLARLGRTTQVILFTHHAHVGELARRHRPSEVAVIRLGGTRAPALEPLAAC